MASKELFLDMKGFCFLCLNDTLNTRDNNCVMPDISLRTICRYLNINSSSIIWNILRGKLEESGYEAFKEKCDFSVNMCSTCLSVTNKLTVLIDELERIQNYLAYQLQKLHNIVTGDDTDSQSSSSSSWTRKYFDLKCSNSVEGNLVESLRSRIKDKCSTKINQAIKTSYPKVLLDRLEPEALEDPLPSHVETIISNSDDFIDDEVPIHIDSSLIIPSPSPIQDMPVLSPQSEHSNDKPDTDMLTYSSSSVPVTMVVEESVEEEEEVELSVERKRTKAKVPRNQRWVCRIQDGGCGKAFTNKANLNFHQRTHCQILGRKEMWSCEITDGGCGRMFSNKHNLSRHQNTYCPTRRGDSIDGNDCLSTITNHKSEDGPSVEMTCAVENVVISKSEVVEFQEENIFVDFEESAQ